MEKPPDIVSEYDPNLNNFIMKLSKAKAGLLIQFLSGHNWLLKHKKAIGKAVSSVCRLCGENVETSKHLLWSCKHLTSFREQYNVSNSVPPPTVILALIHQELADLMDPG